MFLKEIFFVFVLLFNLLLADSCTFNDTCATLSWESADCWSCNKVPSPSDDVLFQNEDSLQFSDQSGSVNQLDIVSVNDIELSSGTWAAQTINITDSKFSTKSGTILKYQSIVAQGSELQFTGSVQSSSSSATISLNNANMDFNGSQIPSSITLDNASIINIWSLEGPSTPSLIQFSDSLSKIDIVNPVEPEMSLSMMSYTSCSFQGELSQHQITVTGLINLQSVSNTTLCQFSSHSSDLVLAKDSQLEFYIFDNETHTTLTIDGAMIVQGGSLSIHIMGPITSNITLVQATQITTTAAFQSKNITNIYYGSGEVPFDIEFTSSGMVLYATYDGSDDDQSLNTIFFSLLYVVCGFIGVYAIFFGLLLLIRNYRDFLFWNVTSHKDELRYDRYNQRHLLKEKEKAQKQALEKMSEVHSSGELKHIGETKPRSGSVYTDYSSNDGSMSIPVSSSPPNRVKFNLNVGSGSL